MAFLPAADSLRSGLDASAPRILAHRRCCASFIRLLVAAENFLRLRVDASGVTAIFERPPESMALTSLIRDSIRLFCSSNPVMAAEMISFESFCVGMSAFLRPTLAHSATLKESPRSAGARRRSLKTRTGTCGRTCRCQTAASSFCSRSVTSMSETAAELRLENLRLRH